MHSYLEYIDEITRSVDNIQKEILAQILSKNANTEYLQRHGLPDYCDRETFKKLIPIATYETLKPDIDRLVNGDKAPILTTGQISRFYVSTGTSSGNAKLIPRVDEEEWRTSPLFSVLKSVSFQFFPDVVRDKAMIFYSVGPHTILPCGLEASCSTTSWFKSQSFQQDTLPWLTSLHETILCHDSYQSIYSQLLCGLYQNDKVTCIGSVFASGLCGAIKFLENHWTKLCSDIHNGTLDASITDSSVIKAVLDILKPNPELAEFIETECREKMWKGILGRLWPNTKCIRTIVTGTMSQYVPILNYYANGIPLVSTIYASSECSFGVNLNPLSTPDEVSYTLFPTVAYFEFAPITKEGTTSLSATAQMQQAENENRGVVDLADVELGQEYELIITNFTGLYRYRVGDVLRVTGFKNKAPEFSIVRRENTILSIDTNKIDEADLQNAIAKAASNLQSFNAILTDYTSYADVSNDPGHYVLFWEIERRKEKSHPIPSSVLEYCCWTIEESLGEDYLCCRVLDKTIGPLEIRIVTTGTFEKLMHQALSRGASMDQYKTPRCIKQRAGMELLNFRVEASYFSQKFPRLDGHIYESFQSEE